jgi:predicted flap endonuclease-1-like 5' DNA nuclease
MFQESPFSGLCAYSTLEVIIMLLGTLLLGVLLGYLIWGWTRRKLQEAEAKILKLTASNTNFKQQINSLKGAQDDQQQEIDTLNTENSSLKRRLDSLYVNNTDLKKQLDDLTNSGQDIKSELAKLQALATTNDTLVTNLYTRLDDEQSRVAKLEKSLKKARAGKSKKTISDESTHGDLKANRKIPTDILASFTDEAAQTPGPAPEPVLHNKATEIFGKDIHVDDLTIVEGIGPKIAEVLNKGGITSWMGLSNTTRHILRVILDEAGSQFRGHKPKTWPRQARMAANGEWKKLQAYQDILLGGK